MARNGPGGLRAVIAAEAARLMYEENVKQYFTAKRLASKRILGRVGGARMRFRPQDLPSNGEIRDALLCLAEYAEGASRTRRLFAMRVTALLAMRELEPFAPRLIGSVSTGHIRRGSDIDLHVFTDDVDPLLEHIKTLGWRFETERVTILKGGAIREFLHVHVAGRYDVELTVYERMELRFRPRSSTDGKPIVRVKPSALEDLLATEHADAWKRFQEDGLLPDIGDDDEEDDETTEVRDLSRWDGFLDDGSEDASDPELAPLPEELVDDDAPYDPLPGFEHV